MCIWPFATIDERDDSHEAHKSVTAETRTGTMVG